MFFFINLQSLFDSSDVFWDPQSRLGTTDLAGGLVFTSQGFKILSAPQLGLG